MRHKLAIETAVIYDNCTIPFLISYFFFLTLCFLSYFIVFTANTKSSKHFPNIDTIEKLLLLLLSNYARKSGEKKFLFLIIDFAAFKYLDSTDSVLHVQSLNYLTTFKSLSLKNSMCSFQLDSHPQKNKLFQMAPHPLNEHTSSSQFAKKKKNIVNAIF